MNIQIAKNAIMALLFWLNLVTGEISRLLPPFGKTVRPSLSRQLRTNQFCPCGLMGDITVVRIQFARAQFPLSINHSINHSMVCLLTRTSPDIIVRPNFHNTAAVARLGAGSYRSRSLASSVRASSALGIHCAGCWRIIVQPVA